MIENQDQKNIEFIPARESRLFISLFGWYVRWLTKFRFKHIWLKQHYRPSPGSRSIYYLNHSSWWDGIIPLLLNRFLFHQNARAMMEDTQMKRYKFFRRLGAFSVSPNETRRSARSLRYAVESMQRNNASLFIFPEGEIVPFTANQPVFRDGLSWLCRQLPETDVIPIGIYIHTLRYNRPELHIQIGHPVDVINPIAKLSTIRDILEKNLQKQLVDLQTHGGFDDNYFVKWM